MNTIQVFCRGGTQLLGGNLTTNINFRSKAAYTIMTFCVNITRCFPSLWNSKQHIDCKIYSCGYSSNIQNLIQRNYLIVVLFHQPTLMHNFLYSLTICLLHYYPRQVSSINMPIFRMKIVFTQHLVTSLSVNVCTVHWLRADSPSEVGWWNNFIPFHFCNKYAEALVNFSPAISAKKLVCKQTPCNIRRDKNI